jgi:hypothetical protein
MNGMTERLLRFPQRFSMGGLYTAPLSQPETWDLFATPLGLIVNPENQPINWQWLDEAQGRCHCAQPRELQNSVEGVGQRCQPTFTSRKLAFTVFACARHEQKPD